MKYLLGLLVGFEILDGVLSYFLIKNDLGREANLFLQPLVGDVNFLILKVVGGFICALILWDIYRRFPRLALVTTSCFTVVYAAIASWDLGVFFTA
jgi:hypothetical protein